MLTAILIHQPERPQLFSYGSPWKNADTREARRAETIERGLRRLIARRIERAIIA